MIFQFKTFRGVFCFFVVFSQCFCEWFDFDIIVSLLFELMFPVIAGYFLNALCNIAFKLKDSPRNLSTEPRYQHHVRSNRSLRAHQAARVFRSCLSCTSGLKESTNVPGHGWLRHADGGGKIFVLFFIFGWNQNSWSEPDFEIFRWSNIGRTWWESSEWCRNSQQWKKPWFFRVIGDYTTQLCGLQ